MSQSKFLTVKLSDRQAEVQTHSPKLALYEIANALTRLIVGDIFPREQLESAWLFLNDLPVVYHDIAV